MDKSICVVRTWSLDSGGSCSAGDVTLRSTDSVTAGVALKCAQVVTVLAKINGTAGTKGH